MHCLSIEFVGFGWFAIGKQSSEDGVTANAKLFRTYKDKKPCRSSHWKRSVNKSVYKNFANFTRKHLVFLWNLRNF